MSDKYVYLFGGDTTDGGAEMKNLLGGKGANLAEMAKLGMPVPPGYTITTEVCTYYYENGESYPGGMKKDVEAAMAHIEKTMGAKFGDAENPLLVSVRSGARASMPGMMDTVLNLGLNDTTIQGIIKRTDNPRFAYDSYRRFVSMYGDVVLGLKPESKHEEDPFEVILHKKKEARGVKLDNELSADDLKELVAEFKAAIKEKVGKDFPEDPMEQLWGAIGAVFGSWMNDRAIEYRRIYKIPASWGTAVNVQAMVFGNTGDDSGTGVAFTRDPATGEKRFYGEFLMNAQGEDVVAGIRTPKTIDELEGINKEAYDQLVANYKKLESHYKDMQDLEFTIQDKRLWMLQTRVGKRTGLAAIRIATEMVDEGLIDKEEALMRLDPESLNQLLRPVFDRADKQAATDAGRVLAKGLNAGPGAASGKVVFSAPDAVEWKKKGEQVLLVRIETSPEDIKGMNAAEGILTAQGGMTSHAALVARQMGKVCVAGCSALNIDYAKGQMEVGGKTVKEGDWLSIDGTTGEVIEGQLKTLPSEVLQVLLDETLKPEEAPSFQLFDKIMTWADECRRLGVRTNADQPNQSAQAIAFGAEGIGLCRTEHMFFGGERISAVRQMILSESEKGRRAALEKILPMQRGDFEGIFRVMESRPVTIRLLDPPLHEFLPHSEKDIAEVAKEMGVPAGKVKERNAALHEFNPMLGHRGCRLGITYPEVYEMQVRAIMEAACTVKKEGVDVHPEIMIPLTGHKTEMQIMRDLAVRIADDVVEKSGLKVEYLVGTMIELPRACLVADQIAAYCQFFSFGTNDLTQTTYGLSRDDVRNFLPTYIEDGIYKVDPFVSIDQEGMGQLIKMGVKKGRSVKTKLKIGICGEHGGEPDSVDFCHRTGFDYVSCSPYRVPIARLSAAIAAIREKRG
ncbi:MAG: pyruvate, phosphate dikinase [Deltaproteobacteria bacterium]|jgi:pyruvate,orthophosphate dikinase|nr:pyruvate, phosphate dikinase [Deltaproteobacteria bacterium]MBW2535564.1 pyruvate, phosphate dikinase [Deltaproteobacteria bacterium]